MTFNKIEIDFPNNLEFLYGTFNVFNKTYDYRFYYNPSLQLFVIDLTGYFSGKVLKIGEFYKLEDKIYIGMSTSTNSTEIPTRENLGSIYNLYLVDQTDD